jgi:hypothetical protein
MRISQAGFLPLSVTKTPDAAESDSAARLSYHHTAADNAGFTE